jgi:hypothetical protein
MRGISLFCALALGLALLTSPLPGQAAGEGKGAFLSAIQDLPLMPGLAEEVESGMSFDSEQGRIVEAVASGPVKAEDALSFYNSALPQLGWRPAGTGAWKREGEVLRLKAQNLGGKLTVLFSLSPADPKSR